MNTTLVTPRSTHSREGTTDGVPDLGARHPKSNVERAGITASPSQTSPLSQLKTMDKGRFAFGLLLSAAGIAALLLIAVGLVQQSGLAERFSLPLVACVAIMGIMMLGGGFGLMATAAAGFDDGEFERLMDAGNISAVELLTSEDSLRTPPLCVESPVTTAEADSRAAEEPSASPGG